MRFDCHICCDVVSTSACVEYLFKYCVKGSDHALGDVMLRFTRAESKTQALREVDLKLQIHGKSTVQYNLPTVVHREIKLQRMAHSFDPSQLNRYAVDMELFISFVYPNLSCDHRVFHDKTILATINAMIDIINDTIIRKISGVEVKFISVDSMIAYMNISACSRF